MDLSSLFRVTALGIPLALVASADYGLVGSFDVRGEWRWRDGLVAHVGGLAVNGDGDQLVLVGFVVGQAEIAQGVLVAGHALDQHVGVRARRPVVAVPADVDDGRRQDRRPRRLWDIRRSAASVRVNTQ